VKRIALIAALASAVGAGTELRAQRLEYLGAGGGVVVPTGSFGDVDQAGWHLSALAIGRLKRSVHWVVDALYAHTSHQGGVSGSSTLAGGSLSAALLLGPDTRRIRPLVSAGAGLFRVNVDVPGFGSAAATKLAPTMGAGVLVGTGRRRGFLIVRYVSVGTSPQTTSFVPISAGLILALQ
jgi:hypothetical protein